jgi:hypothetical protein
MLLRGRNWIQVGLTVMTLLGPASAVRGEPIERPALEAAGVTITQAQIESGELSLEEIRRQGRLVFSTPFNTADGYGDGPEDASEDPILPGGRPTLQGNGTFLRVNGLDGQSCLECHSIVSNAVIPARFGVGGVGGSVTNAIFRPSLIDVARAGTGFDGRFINPPFLFGSGGIQLLAAEMTADLQALADRAVANPGKRIRLSSKGIDFGSIRYAQGELDVSNVLGVDADLVVRPFGRKGEFASVREFDLDALRFHFGMEPVESVGAGNDADDDGVADEITLGQVSALEIFNTTLERPFQQRLSAGARRGRRGFLALGCGGCHVPVLVTRSRVLEYRVSSDDEVYFAVDLSRAPAGFGRIKGAGLAVPLFADLKRHDMGPALAESFGSDLDRHFTTARLWGVADTAPYLHDGRATTLSEAILMHGGEAEDSALAFAQLSRPEQLELIEFLRSLRTPENPSGDLDRPRSHPRPGRAPGKAAR